MQHTGAIPQLEKTGGACFGKETIKKNVRVGTSKTRTRNTSQRQRKQNNDNAPGPSCNLKKLGDGFGREHIRKFKNSLRSNTCAVTCLAPSAGNLKQLEKGGRMFVNKNDVKNMSEHVFDTDVWTRKKYQKISKNLESSRIISNHL
jgi:hypothetical protein